MVTRGHRSDYDNERTARCERVLLTLLGDVGPWSDRIYLVGGLAPRYIVGLLPEGVTPHVGTTDVDLVIALAIDGESEEAYNTLQTNLERSGFHQDEPSFSWSREVDGFRVVIDFMCETDAVAAGRIFRPREGHGSKLGAINVRGAGLVARDFTAVEIDGERLDGGGRSRVELRVAGVLSYAVLKLLAFQERHQNKDAYDLVFTLLNHDGGPGGAGELAAASPIRKEHLVEEALVTLNERFSDVEEDGPAAYAAFLADPDDGDADLLHRRQAVATVAAFLGPSAPLQHVPF